MVFKKASWITTPTFAGLKPLNLLHKANIEPQHITHVAYDDKLLNTHVLVRKTFTLQQQLKSTIWITADDYYKLYINGHFIGQGPAPSYHYHYNVNEYDISDFLQVGDNVIAVHVYYQGLVNRVWNSGDYRMGLCAEIMTEHRGLESSMFNDKVILHTDNTWKYHIAEEFISRDTIGYDTQFVEDIDNRKKIIGWKELSFDDGDWAVMCINENADYTFFSQITPSVSVYNMFPVEIREIADGNLLIDFGQEITGRVLLTILGNRGDEIEIHYGEELENPEKVRSEMRCNCRYIEKLILSGNEDLLENYDYKAFRYVQILSKSANVKKESIAVEVRHYPFDEIACKFDSSNQLINRIWEICKNAVKFGTQEGFLDCPSREKGQYLGDVTIIAQAFAYLTGDLRIYKKSLNDFALSARICPGLMAVAPGSFMQEIADYSLQWPLQLLKYYKISGDIRFLSDMLPIAQGIIDYFSKFTGADGLIKDFKDKAVLVDWPANLRDNYDYKLMPDYQDGCNTVLNAFYIGAIKAVNEIYSILGKREGDNGFARLEASFINAFYDAETGLFKDSKLSSHHSLHANVLALFFDITPDKTDTPDNRTRIIDFIKQKRFSCGVYFSYFVLKTLANAGEFEFIYELLTSDDERSWGNMINEGATTCFEAWGKEQKWNTSLCHPWASSPIIILTEHPEILQM